MKFAPNFHHLPVDAALVETLRENFLAKAGEEPDRYDQRDLDRVRASEWETRRFLAVQQHDHPKRWAAGGGTDKVLSAALEHMTASYRWRRAHNVNDIYEAGPAAVAQEFFNPSWLALAGPDSDGRIYMVNHMMTNSSVPDMEAWKNFIIWYYEMIARECAARRSGMITIADHGGASLPSYSCLSLTNFQFEAVHHLWVGCSLGCKQINESMLIKAAVSSMMGLASGEAVRETSFEKLADVLAAANSGGKNTIFPDWLQPNGGGVVSRLLVPGAKSIRELSVSGGGGGAANSKDLDAFVKQMEKVAAKQGGQVATLAAGTTDAYLQHFLR